MMAPFSCQQAASVYKPRAPATVPPSRNGSRSSDAFPLAEFHCGFSECPRANEFNTSLFPTSAAKMEEPRS